MKQKYMKRIGSFLLTGAIVLTLFPMSYTEVHAAELPDKTQFAAAGELKGFNTDDTDGFKNPAKVYFGKNGNNDQQWWIAGSQDKNLVLFAASPLATEQRFEQNYYQNKAYNEKWECDYTSTGGTAPSDVYPNHYGASPLRATFDTLEESNFTEAEHALMNTTTVYTNDTRNGSVYSTTDTLYLAYGDHYDNKYITVGANNSGNLNSGLRVALDYWGSPGTPFWLRAPHLNISSCALMAIPGDDYVYSSYVNNAYALVPAFALNLSSEISASVLFGSAAPAAAADGELTLEDTDGDGAFTLRHSAKEKDLGSAQISYDKRQVTVKDVPADTYLVAQNSEKAVAKKITAGMPSVTAADLGLASFAGCQVWLEKTDAATNMTYAVMAEEKQGYSINITASEGLNIVSGNGKQEVAANTAIADIRVEIQEGYVLPEDYMDGIQGLNGLGADKTGSGFTISGTPEGDVNITLPAATKKDYSMTVTGDGTFTAVCKDYQPITANEFHITNNGNVDLENVKVSLTGNDADKFELSVDKTTTIQPNGTINAAVKPNNELGVGTYQAALSVSADNAVGQSIDLQFTVSEHEYDAVVTQPTCTQKGYTTYTCKKCSHSYVGDEVIAKGHTFGEWEIITSPNCDQGGSRKHICKDCGEVETENLNPNGHAWEDDYTVDKKPTCTEDGSQSIHCRNCDAVKDSTAIARLGHSYTNYVSDNNATCTEDGTKTAKCERCDKTSTIVDEGSKLEHEYEWVSNKDATCEKNGTETGTCRRCQATVTREQADSALGHDLGEWKVIKDATATETGIKERHCARCDYKETESIPAVSKPAQPNGSSSDKDHSNSDTKKESPKTGDQANIGLFTALLSMSAFVIVALTALKKKKA